MLGPISVGLSKGGGLGLQYKSGELENGQWRLGVALGGERGPSFGLQWKKIF